MSAPIRPLKPARRDPARIAAAQGGGDGDGDNAPLSDPAIAKALQLKSFEVRCYPCSMRSMSAD